MKVYELSPGDVVEVVDKRSIFIGSMPHPIYRNLSLVIWRILDDDSVSFDALRSNQDVGSVVGSGPDFLKHALGIRG